MDKTAILYTTQNRQQLEEFVVEFDEVITWDNVSELSRMQLAERAANYMSDQRVRELQEQMDFSFGSWR